MAEWPELGELKQLLDITSEDWDGTGEEAGTRLTRLLSSAIDYVKEVVAGTIAAYDDLYYEPTDRHAQAALRVGELLATRPEATPLQDPTLRRLLFGARRRFGIA